MPSTETLVKSEARPPVFRPQIKMQTFGIDLSGNFKCWGETPDKAQSLQKDQGLEWYGKPVLRLNECKTGRHLGFIFKQPNEEFPLLQLNLKCNGNYSNEYETVLIQNHVSCLVNSLYELVQQTALQNLDLYDMSGTMYASRGTATYAGTFLDLWAFDGQEQRQVIVDKDDLRSTRNPEQFEAKVNSLCDLLHQPRLFIASANE